MSKFSNQNDSSSQSIAAAQHTTSLISYYDNSQQQGYQMHELLEHCDSLRRELQRKESRNDKLTKELQRIRLSYDHQQRELKSMMVMLDKLQEEKLQASTELMKVSTSKQKLRKQVRSLSYESSTEVSDLMRSTERIRSHLEEEVSNLKGALTLRDHKIEALVKELEIAHRSMEVQNNYQNPHKYPHIAAVTSDTSREAMRTLYFDLGKKQAEIHALTLTLSETKHQLNELQMKRQELEDAREALLSENERLRSSVDSFTSQSIGYNDTITELQDQLEKKEEQIHDLQSSLSNHTQRLTQLKFIYNETVTTTDTKIEELTQLYTTSEKERANVTTRFEALQASMNHIESMHAKSLDQLKDDTKKLHESSQQLSSKEIECHSLRSQLESTQLTLSNIQQEKSSLSMTVSQLQEQLAATKMELERINQELLETESKHMSTDMILSNKREELNQIVTERNEAVEALKQTMSATRDLSQKYQKERELRFAAEKMSEQLQKAKNNFSACTIEALHRERQKTAALEKSLSLIPLLLRYKDLQWKDPTLPFANSAKKSSTKESFNLPTEHEKDLRLARSFGDDPSIELPLEYNEQQMNQVDTKPTIVGLRSCTPAESLSEIIDAARPPNARKNLTEEDTTFGSSTAKNPLSSASSGRMLRTIDAQVAHEPPQTQSDSNGSGNSNDISSNNYSSSSERRGIASYGSSSPESSSAGTAESLPVHDGDKSLLDELKRLRDELRRIETQIPADLSNNTSAQTT